MNTARNVLIALSLCVVLPGCARIKEAALPVSGKVNAAFPVPADVQAAHDRLQVLLASDAKASEIFAAETDSRLTVRALDCAKGLSIGRLDSVASDRGLPVDRGCLQDRDRELLQFYGIRTIGVLIAEPPLRPRKAVGPISKLPRGRLMSINYGTVARDANVAVMQATEWAASGVGALASQQRGGAEGGLVGSPRWARRARIEAGSVRKAIRSISPWQRGQVSGRSS